jgi:circadian clock protein KaiB
MTGPSSTRPELTLFISGQSNLSARAIGHARNLCDIHLDGRYDLSVVDVHDAPAVARSHRVLATPTLLKQRPAPTRRYVGDIARTDRVLLALGLQVANTAPTASG